MSHLIIILSLVFFGTLGLSIWVMREPNLVGARLQTVLATLFIATLDILILLAYFLRAII
jgi:hypothetical protein